MENNAALVSYNGLVPNRRQAIILTDADRIHWRIYVALGGDQIYITDARKIVSDMIRASLR